MNNTGDDKIDIPLAKIETRTGARRSSQEAQQHEHHGPETNEKAGFYNRHVAGRRKATKAKKKDDDGEGITSMGLIYHRLLNFSIVTRYLLYVLPVSLIIAIPIIIGATAAQDAKIGCVRLVWVFSWLLIVWASLWTSKLVAIEMGRFITSA